MSTIYMSQLSTLPLMEGDQDQGHFQAFHLAKDPPILFPFMIENPSEHQGKDYGDQHLRQQFLGESNQQINNHMMMAGGSDVFATPSPYRPTIQSIHSDMIQRSSYNPYDLENKNAIHGSTSEWASGRPPVKMRIIRKVSTNDHEGGVARKPRRRAQAHQADESHLQQHAMGVIRVCSDCNTSKTPLWRSGPRGPKSLCNACGIRQRKARRAMAAAAAVVAASGGAAVTASHGGVAAAGEQATSQAAKPIKKEKRDLDVDRSLPFKKRCKMVDHPTDIATKAVASCVDAALKKDDGRVSLEDVPATERLSKPNPPVTIIHDFTRDEITDAAVLLMNLSCGVVPS
ncbi:protein CYTOKININ-RESPONSIVE GATA TRANSCRIPTION FACTOR 1-like [Lolium rigidum]|uniref:protein CYTOKININ-RESPONSIVE GATA TRANSCRIPTION FACTOR 1-like n=1 Tax=Lolium rigidum TaxID=89674 RepID=UPI001F5D4778|nr:protein CYTOKININ-RESPONSIVE GATA TRANSCRIPTION FACTOR 1-like [Lolium rigidum]